jgi:hypothetical protein
MARGVCYWHYRPMRRDLLPILFLPIFVAACGGAGVLSTIPATSQKAASTTRAYLSGPGHGLLQMNSMASSLKPSTLPGKCRSEVSAFLALASDPKLSEGVADKQLAELLIDEESALAMVLTDCSKGLQDTKAVDTLGTMTSAVSSRLDRDGVRS